MIMTNLRGGEVIELLITQVPQVLNCFFLFVELKTLGTYTKF